MPEGKKQLEPKHMAKPLQTFLESPKYPMQNCAIGLVLALHKLSLASFKMRLYSTVYEAYDGLEYLTYLFAYKETIFSQN